MTKNILERELLDHLQKKYKIEGSIYLGGGWIKPVVDMLEKLEKLPWFEHIELDQIKEKFGSLRVYWSKLPDSPDLSEAQSRAIFSLIEEAEKITDKTCYFCGKPGTRNTIKYFVCVRCEACTLSQQ